MFEWETDFTRRFTLDSKLHKHQLGTVKGQRPTKELVNNFIPFKPDGGSYSVNKGTVCTWTEIKAGLVIS